MKKTKIIAILSAFVILTAMTGIAAADPGGSASPAEVTVDLPGDTPTNIQFQFWDLTVNTVDEARFYMWQDNNNDGVGDDLDLDGNFQENPDDLCNHIEMSWDGANYFTNSLIVTDATPPSIWDSVVGGTPLPAETTYTKTIKVRDANNGATTGDRYFISGSAGASTVPVQVLVTNTDIIPVPEFATIAIPAVAILGLFLFFNHRKHKKE